MPVWIIVDRWYTFPLQAFDCEAAALHYIKANNMLDAHPQLLSVYSLDETRRIWVDD